MPQQPTPSDPQDEGEDDSSIFRSRLALWIYLAVFLALVVHLVLNRTGTDAATIEYSTFLDYVESGYVERVEVVDDAQINGTYTREAVEAGDVRRPKDEGSGLLEAEAAADERAFRTTKPSDHELTALLRAHNRRVEAGEARTRVHFSAEAETDWASTLLFWLIPLALLALVWIFFVRRMNPGSQMLSIGKNTATLFESSEQDLVTFDDVAGLDEAKEEVAEVVEFLKNPEKFTRLGGQLPKGVLLVGPPGTGKTLMAKAVAGEAGVPFFSISGSDFVEMFVGVGASRVRDLFKNAKEKAPCIIFIDEIDAVGRSRGRGNMTEGNDERENTLNQLLAEMDGFDSDEGVIIMAATNRPDVLDDALLRPGRFDRQILVEKPDRIAREEIFQVHVRTLTLAEDVELEILAGQTPGFAGAEIANVCNEAALLAARKDKARIEMEDFERSIDRVIAGLEKKNKIISPEEREVIAYHESGHAIVGWFLEHTDPVVKVSIVPRGMSALGHAQYLPEERYLHSTEALTDRMTMALGGRVAEEIVFDRVTTGAQNDLERITKMAYAMVTDYGMSERVGNVSFNLSRDDGDAPMFDKPYSDATAQIIDEEVKDIIEGARARARELLQEKRAQLDEMAEALIDREVLGPEALIDILGERPHGEYVAVNRRGKRLANADEAASEEPLERDGSSSESGSSEDPSETHQNGVP
ncbi:MAG: AAA family ATPase [Bacteroidetes bacterium SW_9_63_38]|nr:MAG: AAA family ATPase [Bacteroidetes bacterium SW_9_63_38]